ncbi:hypothetical protein [Gemmatimonas sp.]|uniref:hypothetical protein n=1 Tax=Gemmatimonas sp. TaxID=1962908 RepID=UPI00356A403B
MSRIILGVIAVLLLVPAPQAQAQAQAQAADAERGSVFDSLGNSPLFGAFITTDRDVTRHCRGG